MSIRHLLDPVPVKYHLRHRSSPVARVIVGRPPTAVVTRAVIKLERMDLEQIEIHSQRRGKAPVARPTASELGFHAIKAAAPVPMIVAFMLSTLLFSDESAAVRLRQIGQTVNLHVNVGHIGA